MTSEQKIKTKHSVDKAWKESAWIFLFSRFILVSVGCFAVSFLSPTSLAQVRGAPEVLLHSNHNDIVTYLLSWWRWDADFYVRIAAHGYWPGVTVFFPLWPAIIHIFGLIFIPFINKNIAYYLSGVIAANILFYLASVMLYKITVKKFSIKIARYTIILLSCSPYSLFFFAGYTESLFLCLSVATFFFLQHDGERNWLLAIIFASLASITREAGILLTIPFIVVLTRHLRIRKQLQAQYTSLFRLILPLTSIPLAVICYMLYLYHQYGNPLLFVTAAIKWNRHPVVPGSGIYTDIFSLITGTIPHTPSNIADLLFSIGALIIIIISVKKLPPEYSLFSLASWLFFTSTVTYGSGPLMSYPRYAVVIFPVFITIASLLEKHKILKFLSLCLSIIYLSINIVSFVTNNWVA